MGRLSYLKQQIKCIKGLLVLREHSIRISIIININIIIIIMYLELFVCVFCVKVRFESFE